MSPQPNTTAGKVNGELLPLVAKEGLLLMYLTAFMVAQKIELWDTIAVAHLQMLLTPFRVILIKAKKIHNSHLTFLLLLFLDCFFILSTF